MSGKYRTQPINFNGYERRQVAHGNHVVYEFRNIVTGQRLVGSSFRFLCRTNDHARRAFHFPNHQDMMPYVEMKLSNPNDWEIVVVAVEPDEAARIATENARIEKYEVECPELLLNSRDAYNTRWLNSPLRSLSQGS